MIRGIIKSRHVLWHPMLFIKLYGVWDYIKLIGKCMSPVTYFFVHILPK